MKDNISSDEMPQIMFHRLNCNACHIRYAVMFDGNNYLYFDAQDIPRMPLMYTVAGNPLVCPKCDVKMVVKAVYAALTSEGQWLLLDETMRAG